MSNNDKGSLPKIKLIVGLGNPQENLLGTRHNAGYWYLDKFLEKFNVTLSEDKKINSYLSKIDYKDEQIFLMKPTFFINDSGKSVSSFIKYYKITPESILVIHDDIDLDVGDIRLKFGGGHGGHNGLRDIISHLGKNYWRLRVGVGHPGEKSLVHNYVLGKPSKKDELEINISISESFEVIDILLDGEFEKFTKILHTG
jgi:PTH1 family peptidyl-tRNA hydrolase|tara:strand:+ start:707 stop:1303 length:597 start_codon:yes stop_codon:yes gene_type:complete